MRTCVTVTHVDTKPTGRQLRKARERANVSATTLGRAMGYGKSPHAHVLHLEREARPSEQMAARYLAALAELTGGAA